MIPRRWTHRGPNEAQAIRQALKSAMAFDEAQVAAWEEAFAGWLGIPGAAAVTSGRRGLVLALEHFGIGSGDEVIVSAYTFGEILAPIQALGAQPVPADIDPLTLNATPESIAGRITSRTKAILALHVFGSPCDIGAIAQLARGRGIRLIEDCAHAVGARVDGQPVGMHGDAAFFSFEMNKHINTYGGGMVVSDNCALLDKIREANRREPLHYVSFKRKMRTVQMENLLFYSRLAYPFLYLLATPGWKDKVQKFYRRIQDTHRSHERYSPVQAALGISRLAGLEERVRMRRERAKEFIALAGDAVQPQQVLPGAESSYYFLIAILPSLAASIRKRLIWKGVDAGVEHEVMDDCAAILGYDDCPNVREIYQRAMALPMYDGMTEQKMRRVARALKSVL